MSAVLVFKKSPEKILMGSSSGKVDQDNQVNEKPSLFTEKDYSINQNENLTRGSMNEFKNLQMEVKNLSDNLWTSRVDTKNVVIVVKDLSQALLEVKNKNSEKFKKLEERFESISDIIERQLHENLAKKIYKLESMVESMSQGIIARFAELQEKVDKLEATIHDQSRFISEEPSQNEVVDNSDNKIMSTWKGDEETSENLRMRKKVFS
jgi:uncharacterized protein HemX